MSISNSNGNPETSKESEGAIMTMENRTAILLDTEGLTPIRDVDERLVSYNIEMTEVTGGTFWKAYTP